MLKSRYFLMNSIGRIPALLAASQLISRSVRWTLPEGLKALDDENKRFMLVENLKKNRLKEEKTCLNEMNFTNAMSVEMWLKLSREEELSSCAVVSPWS
jgi:hypothetical protein